MPKSPLYRPLPRPPEAQPDNPVPRDLAGRVLALEGQIELLAQHISRLRAELRTLKQAASTQTS
jgi:hypothetical protein